MSKRIKHLLKWITADASITSNIFRRLVGIALLLMLLLPLTIIVGIGCVYAPLLCLFLIAFCLIAPIIILIFAMILSGIRTKLLITGCIISCILCVFMVGTLFFRATFYTGLPFLDSLQNRLFRESSQLPLGNIEFIAVDKSGFIYIGERDYRRIQKYDNTGRFVKGWFVDPMVGYFTNIWIDNDQLHATSRRTGKYIIYSLDGNIITSSRLSSNQEQIDKAPKNAEGNIYLSQSSIWNSRVIKITPSGKYITVISNPFYSHLLAGKISAGIIFAIGILMTLIYVGIMKLRIYLAKIRIIRNSSNTSEARDKIRNMSTNTMDQDMEINQ